MRIVASSGPQSGNLDSPAMAACTSSADPAEAISELRADWGWQSADQPGGVIFIEDTLAESFRRVARFGGRWRLVTAVPVREFYRAMATAAVLGTEK